MRRQTATILLIIMAAAYAALVIPSWNLGHLDFGDGNYMYISWRVAAGDVLYKDVLAPQPPMHLYTGALIYWLGSGLEEPLYAFRAFSLVIHLATMLVVFLLAARITRSAEQGSDALGRTAGVIAALVYLLLPIGFWWALGYQSEPLEMLFFLLALLLFLTWSKKWMWLSGALSALAPLTNMTAAPYTIFNIGVLAVRRRELVWRYAVAVVAVWAGVTALMEVVTEAYLENVVLNQVGSFPRKEFLGGRTIWDYAFGKIMGEGADVLRLEGAYVLLGLLGLLRFARRGADSDREYLTFYSFFALCSIIYVSKGGTMDYIFTIGEPFVAIFAGYLLAHFWAKHLSGHFQELSWRNWTPVATAMTLVMALLAVTFVGLQHSRASLLQATATSQVYELPEHETLRLVNLIKRHSKPDGLILSPPHYAFLSKRKIAENYSELFLWSLKYHNEKQDKSPGRGMETADRIAELLREKKIDCVLLDMGQTGRIPPIREALEAHYTSMWDKPYRSLNTDLQFYIPRK